MSEKPSDLPSVLFDHQIFDDQTVGGISRIFAELVERSLNRYDARIGLRATRNQYLLAASELPVAEKPRHEPIIGKGKQIAYRFLKRPVPTRLVDEARSENRRYGLSLLQSSPPDAFAPTYYDPYIFAEPRRVPVVATLYDMIPEKFPEFFLGNDKHSRWKREMMNKCDRIVSISESTKADLVELWGIDPVKVFVAPLGNSFSDLPPDRIGTGPIEHPYLLFVGGRRGYKNFYFMMEALIPFLKRNPEFRVFCVGAPFARVEEEFLESRHLQESVVQGSGDDEFLAGTYRNASCLIYPSLAEGFGLPLVEALSFGCPVVASRIPVFQEVAGDEIEYFDPKDPGELRNVVERVVRQGRGDSADFDRRRRKAAEYSWDRTADQYANAFRSVL